MPSVESATVTQMVESLPDRLRGQVVDHLREYVADLRDEFEWDETFRRTQPGLAAAARRAREQISRGLASPLDPDQL